MNCICGKLLVETIHIINIYCPPYAEKVMVCLSTGPGPYIPRKEMIDIRNMIEDDWLVVLSFIHRITGIDLKFFRCYMEEERDFELGNVTPLSVGVNK